MTGPRVNPYLPKQEQKPETKKRVNPYLSQVSSSEDDYDLEDDNLEEPGFWNTLGGALKYITDLTLEPVRDTSHPFTPIYSDLEKGKENRRRAFEVAMNLGKDALGIISKTGGPTSGYGLANPDSYASQLAKLIGEKGPTGVAGTVLSGINPVNIIKSLPHMITIPFEALSGTKNVNGEVIPATPEEQAQKIESAAGMALQLIAATRVTKALIPAMNEAEAVINYTNRSRVGRIVHNIKPQVAGQSAGGAVYGFMSGLQDDTEVAQALNGVLTFAPIGVLAGMVKTPKITREANKTIEKFIDETPTNAQEIAALRSLQNTSQSNIKSAIANIDAISSSDNLITAAVKSKLEIGEGIIVEGLSKDRITKLAEELSPSERIVKGYVPSPQVDGILKRASRSNIGGMIPTGMEFLDPFDAASYFARGKSKSAGKIMADIVDQTGLSEAEVRAHGNKVREFIREQAQKNAFSPRSEIQIEQMNKEIMERGSVKLVTMNEGKTIKAADGSTWTKLGETITDGKEVLSVLSDRAKKIAGRDPKGIDAESRVVKVPKQNFEPESGRQVYKFNVYEGGKSTLVTPYRLNDVTKQFFEDTGFMPNEIVAFGGIDYIVRKADGDYVTVESISSGEQFKLDKTSSFFTRQSNGLASEFFKDRYGNKIARAGLLNSENYFNQLYNKFKEEFALDKLKLEGDVSYQDAIIKFANRMGVENPGDIRNMQIGFYSKINKDIRSSMNPQELAGLTRAEKNLIEWYTEDSRRLGNKLSRESLGNGMYITADGNGQYSLRDINSGRTLQSFSKIEDGLDFIKNSRRTNGLDLDGGDTGIVPPSSASIGQGAMRDSYTVYRNQGFFSSEWLDAFNVGKYGKFLTPIGNQLASVDRFLGTNFAPRIYQSLQTAYNFQRQFMTTTGKPLFESVQRLEKFAKEKKITDDVRLGYIADNIETMSVPELITKLLPRKLNALEIAKAAELAKVDVNRVIDYMYEVKQEAPDVTYNSVDFALAKKKIAAFTIKDAGGNLVPKYDKAVIDAGANMFDVAMQNKNDLSSYAIIRLAKAIEKPSLALTREAHANKMGLTAQELQLRDMIDAFYNQAGDIFGIDKKARISGYLPHAKIAVATGYNPWAEVGSKVKDGFARELTRIGLTPDASLERNPVQLTRNYLMAGVRTAGVLPDGKSFISHINEAQKVIVELNEKYGSKEINGKPNPDYNPQKLKQIAPYLELVNEHIADMNGVPDHSVRLGKAAGELSKVFTGDASKGAILFTHAAFLGGRLGLTLRDVVNAATNSYMLYGTEFTAKAFGRSFSKEYVTELVEKGILTKQDALDIMMPGETIESALSRITKVGNSTMKWNGQALVHMQVTGGIYKASVEAVLEHSQKLLESKESKQKAYTKLKIQTMEEVWQREFDKLIDAGKSAEAADLLGRYRVKQIVNVYGANNNPIGWNTTAGRLLGQFGSWGANEAQTVGSALLRGTPEQRIAAGLRLAAANAVIGTVGYYTGLNLFRWMVSPFGLFGVGPLVQNVLDIQDDINALASTSPAGQREARKNLMRFVPHDEFSLGQMYIPYSYMVQDFVTGMNMLNNDFGVVGMGRMIGLPVNSEVRSPLQEIQGVTPRNLRSGSRLPEQ